VVEVVKIQDLPQVSAAQAAGVQEVPQQSDRQVLLIVVAVVVVVEIIVLVVIWVAVQVAVV